MRLVAAISPISLVYQDEGRLYNWGEGLRPTPLDWRDGTDRLLEAGRVKHGLRPVVGRDGSLQPEYHGTGFPRLVAGQHAGRDVFFLDEAPAR